MKMDNILIKSFDDADETKNLSKMKLEIVKLDGYTFNKQTYQPGWHWSQDVKPQVKTDWCEMTHVGMLISGQLHIKFSDGTEKNLKPNDVVMISPGHDGWVIGDEPAIFISIEQNK